LRGHGKLSVHGIRHVSSNPQASSAVLQGFEELHTSSLGSLHPPAEPACSVRHMLPLQFASVSHFTRQIPATHAPPPQKPSALEASHGWPRFVTSWFCGAPPSTVFSLLHPPATASSTATTDASLSACFLPLLLIASSHMPPANGALSIQTVTLVGKSLVDHQGAFRPRR